MRPRAMAGVIAAAAAGGARPATADYYLPQMIHLSLTGRPGEMAVDWVSSCADGTSSVMFADNPAHANASIAPAIDHASTATDLGMATRPPSQACRSQLRLWLPASSEPYPPALALEDEWGRDAELAPTPPTAI